MKAKTKLPEIALPAGITAADLEHRCPHKSVAAYDKWREANKLLAYPQPRSLTLYNTERFGWIVTTLLIKSGTRRNVSDRSYGVTLDGQLVRVGFGPHVRRKIEVYLRESRMTDLQPFLDLYNQGLERAHESRDTLSTRRAQGSLRRSRFF
jgi:hypothetical protein